MKITILMHNTKSYAKNGRNEMVYFVYLCICWSFFAYKLNTNPGGNTILLLLLLFLLHTLSLLLLLLATSVNKI